MKQKIYSNDTPVIGFPIAAPFSGKDTVGSGITERRPDIAILHMSMLLQIRIQQNDEFKTITKSGGLLPPDEAFKAFRCGFVDLKKNSPTLPHIYANGACREKSETKWIVRLIKRTCLEKPRIIAFRFLLDPEHIKARAAQRIEQFISAGKEPRLDDLGETPVNRYNIFQKNVGPVLTEFKNNGGEVVDIDANPKPQEVLEQILRFYGQGIVAESLA